jgi:hypothetical protein
MYNTEINAQIFSFLLQLTLRQGSKLTYVRQSVTDKNPGGHIDFFTYQSDLAHSDWLMYFKKIFGGKKKQSINVFCFLESPQSYL